MTHTLDGLLRALQPFQSPVFGLDTFRNTTKFHFTRRNEIRASFFIQFSQLSQIFVMKFKALHDCVNVVPDISVIRSKLCMYGVTCLITDLAQSTAGFSLQYSQVAGCGLMRSNILHYWVYGTQNYHTCTTLQCSIEIVGAIHIIVIIFIYCIYIFSPLYIYF